MTPATSNDRHRLGRVVQGHGVEMTTLGDVDQCWKEWSEDAGALAHVGLLPTRPIGRDLYPAEAGG